MTTTRIEADLMIPGDGAPLHRAAIVIEDAVIVFAGDSAAAPSTPDADVVEVPVAMPGLWEAHGHFSGTPPDLETIAKEPIALRAARATADMARTLAGGVTSVRELGGLGISLRRAVEEGAVAGPHVYPAGDILSQTGGHGDVHSFPLDWIPGGASGFSMLCDGVPECLRAVRSQLRAGASVIKVCASGGVMSQLDHPSHQQFSDEELAAIVGEAARAERVVAAHCHGKAGIMAALRAGVKTIEHGTELDEEAVEAMKASGAILVATRFVIDALLENPDGVPDFARRKMEAVADRHAGALRLAVESGVTLATGTDIFITGETYGRNGAEIRLLVEAGADPLVAIAAATANGPLTLGPQAPRSGRLEEGYDADVIALDDNPLDDPTLWGDPSRVTHVWKAGDLVKGPA